MALAVAVVALGLLAAGLWAAVRDEQQMSADQAREFTQRALAASGVEGAVVAGRPRPATFQGEGAAVPVWVVPVRVADHQIEVYVDRRGDQAVNLDDQVGADAYVLSSQQFEALDSFQWDPVSADQRRRLAAPAAAAVALAVGVGTATVVAVARRRVHLPSLLAAVA